MEYAIQLAAIFGTIGLLWLTLQMLRRSRGNGIAGPRVHVRQRVAIANGCQLVVVQWDGQELLIATGNQKCTLVACKPVSDTQVHAEASGAWAH